MAETQYVMFQVGSGKYAVDILNVGGIVEYSEITAVPNAPHYVEGIINLRGNIVPVVSLKKRFSLESKETSTDTRIILHSIKGKDVGFIVDEASQVIKLSEEDIEPVEGVVSSIGSEFISGIGKNAGEILIILDFDQILSDEEKEQITSG